jgi:Tfp pilus assembly protein PilN
VYDFIEINLLPAEYRVHKRAVKLQAEIVWPLFGVLLVGGLLLGFYGMLENQKKALISEIATLDSNIRINAPIEQEIKKLAEEKKVIVGKIMALERISVNRAKWVRLLETLCRHVPDFTWLVSVREGKTTPPTLVIQGKTRAFPEVATYMADLKQSMFVTDVELSKIEQVSSSEKVFGFELTCTIDPNAGLTERETAEQLVQ